MLFTNHMQSRASNWLSEQPSPSSGLQRFTEHWLFTSTEVAICTGCENNKLATANGTTRKLQSAWLAPVTGRKLNKERLELNHITLYIQTQLMTQLRGVWRGGTDSQLKDDYHFSRWLEHFVQFDNAMMVHTLANNVDLHHDISATRLASATLPEILGRKVLPGGFLCAFSHNGKLSPARFMREKKSTAHSSQGTLRMLIS